MKFQITLLSLVTAFSATAQTTKPESRQSDTLIITSPALPAAAKFGKDVYKLSKAIPGQQTYSFEFTEPLLSALFKCLDLSTGPHVQIEQIKNILREQLKPQMNTPQK